jgi:ATP-dependent DNA helicase DinG
VNAFSGAGRDFFRPGGLLAQVMADRYEYRPEQDRFGTGVAAALALPEAILLVECGTGVGKAQGYLGPALLAGQPFLVAPSTKSLQMQLTGPGGDLETVARAVEPVVGRRPTWVVLKGIGNSLCERNWAAAQARPGFAEDADRAEWLRLGAWRRETPDGDLEALSPPLPAALREEVTTSAEDCDGPECAFAADCHVLKARERARSADVVVVNQALLLADRVVRLRSAGKARLLPDVRVAVLDEAHALIETARGGLGDVVRTSYGDSVERRLRRLSGGDPSWRGAARPLALALARWQDALEADLAAQEGPARSAGAGAAPLVLGDERARAAGAVREATALAAAVTAQGEALRRAGRDDDVQAAARAWLRQGRALQEAAAVLQAVATPLEATAAPDPDAFVRLVERAPASPHARRRAGGRAPLLLRYVRVDVSGPLRLLVWDAFPHVIACSATLTTAPTGPERFDFFRREAGVPPSRPERPVLELVEGSPFPYREHTRLYVPPAGVITADRQRERDRFHDQLAAEVERLLLAAGGRAFCLCTSVATQRALYERLVAGGRLPAHWRLFAQGITPHSREEVLGAFRDADAPAARPCVLLGLRTYMEGVDVRGPGLSLVVLDHLPFQSPGEPVFAARSRQLNRAAGGDAWGHWATLTLPTMVMAVKQAVGRLVRSHRDRGVACVLDRRLVEKGYGRHVVAALPDMPRIRSVAELESFSRRHV